MKDDEGTSFFLVLNIFGSIQPLWLQVSVVDDAKYWFFNLSLRSNKVEKVGKKRGGGFTKLCALSPRLQKFVGVPELARTEVYLQTR